MPVGPCFVAVRLCIFSFLRRMVKAFTCLGDLDREQISVFDSVSLYMVHVKHDGINCYHITYLNRKESNNEVRTHDTTESVT